MGLRATLRVVGAIVAAAILWDIKLQSNRINVATLRLMSSMIKTLAANCSQTSWTTMCLSGTFYQAVVGRSRHNSATEVHTNEPLDNSYGLPH